MVHGLPGGGAEKAGRKGQEMSGLVFRSLADVPAGMRDQAARKLLADARGKQKAVPVAVDSGKGSKYHNEPTEVAGVHFASKKEARRYEQLMVELSLGMIRDLRLQQDFTLQEGYTTPEGQRIRAIRYKADFVYTVCATGQRVIEDTKGKRTDVYMMKRKMMAERGYMIREV